MCQHIATYSKCPRNPKSCIAISDPWCPTTELECLCPIIRTMEIVADYCRNGPKCHGGRYWMDQLEPAGSMKSELDVDDGVEAHEEGNSGHKGTTVNSGEVILLDPPNMIEVLEQPHRDAAHRMSHRSKGRDDRKVAGIDERKSENRAEEGEDEDHVEETTGHVLSPERSYPLPKNNHPTSSTGSGKQLPCGNDYIDSDKAGEESSSMHNSDKATPQSQYRLDVNQRADLPDSRGEEADSEELSETNEIFHDDLYLPDMIARWRENYLDDESDGERDDENEERQLQSGGERRYDEEEEMPLLEGEYDMVDAEEFEVVIRDIEERPTLRPARGWLDTLLHLHRE